MTEHDEKCERERRYYPAGGYIPPQTDCHCRERALEAEVQRLKEKCPRCNGPLIIDRDDEIARLRAKLDAAETVVGSLREDAAGRPVPVLLDLAAKILRGYGGGPVESCLGLKAAEIRVALAAYDRAQGEEGE